MEKNVKLTKDVTEKEPEYKPEQITEIKAIEDSPFTAVKVMDKWFLSLGKYRLTGMLDSEEEVKDEAFNTSWDRLLSVMQIMITENLNKLNK